ncbi:MAG: hypothetical protein HZB43_07895 [candidate division Zixibacteria bacterium]|nr:hypothetical protein [candidate division Zixibacteria bacterium]
MNTDRQIIDTPIYSPAMAARLVALRPERVRRWLEGYQYRYTPPRGVVSQTRQRAPVVARHGTRGSRFASFLDLIDLLFVKRFVEAGISLQRLRLALDEATKLIGDDHFAQEKFWTNGKDIYVQVKDDSVALMQLLSRGQWVIAPVIKQTALQIDFSEVTGLAEKWFPLGRAKRVVLDPNIAFGSPCLLGRGIETANIYDLYKAEKENLKAVCSWMNLHEREVLDAVEFERMLEAA